MERETALTQLKAVQRLSGPSAASDPGNRVTVTAYVSAHLAEIATLRARSWGWRKITRTLNADVEREMRQGRMPVWSAPLDLTPTTVRATAWRANARQGCPLKLRRAKGGQTSRN
jgi:hypothetical protein